MDGLRCFYLYIQKSVQANQSTTLICTHYTYTYPISTDTGLRKKHSSGPLINFLGEAKTRLAATESVIGNIFFQKVMLVRNETQRKGSLAANTHVKSHCFLGTEPKKPIKPNQRSKKSHLDFLKGLRLICPCLRQYLFQSRDSQPGAA